MEEVSIRKFLKSDLDSCRCLWKELVEWHRMLYENNSIGGEHPEEYFDKHLLRIRENLLWVAVIDSKVIGFTSLVLRDNEGEVEPLIVSQAYRHKGVGTKLIKTVVAEAQRLGLKSLSIKPVLRNSDAIGLFNRQGFRSIGQIELYMDFSESKKKSFELFNLQFDF